MRTISWLETSLAAACLRSYANAPAAAPLGALGTTHVDNVDRARLRYDASRNSAFMGDMRLGQGRIAPFADANSQGEVRLEQRVHDANPTGETVRKGATKRGTTGPYPWRQPV